MSPYNLVLMRLLNEKYLRHPFLGVPKMNGYLRNAGYRVNLNRVRRLMQLMKLTTIYPKPNLSTPNMDHSHYPYLLRGLRVDHVNQIWSTEIIYIPTVNGYCYSTAIIDCRVSAQRLIAGIVDTRSRGTSPIASRVIHVRRFCVLRSNAVSPSILTWIKVYNLHRTSFSKACASRVRSAKLRSAWMAKATVWTMFL